MRTKAMCLVMACAAALAAGGAAAQDQSEQTFTGCVEAGKGAGSYMLTHVTAGEAAASGSETKNAGKAPASIDLASASVKIAPHSGHKVTVTGKTMQHDNSTMLMVDSLKMVSKTCP